MEVILRKDQIRAIFLYEFKLGRNAPKTATPTAGIGRQNRSNSTPQQRPIARRTTNTSKVERIELRSFASSFIFT